MNNIIKNILILVVLVLVIWGGVKLSGNKEVELDRPIKVGVIMPLTGALANFGEAQINAINMATEEVNVESEKIQLIIEDSPCDPAEVVTVANKLVNIDKVDVLVGPACSGEVLAISNLLNENKIVTISPLATAPTITDAGDYIFRDVVSDDLKAKVFANYIYNKDIKEIAVLGVNIDASVGYIESFTKKFEELGGKVSITEIYTEGLTDARTQLTKIKEADIKNLLIFGFPAEMGSIVKQTKELNLGVQIFSGVEGIDDPQTIGIAGDAVNGVISIYQKSPNPDFTKKYTAKFGVEPLTYVAEGYDAIKLFEIALKDGIDS
ncbi:penicillin-binding protein activator, partial [Patescibacteria group bacterium]|nr:penicillin-binding protein activator [Patescibacteria group bacterium]